MQPLNATMTNKAKLPSWTRSWLMPWKLMMKLTKSSQKLMTPNFKFEYCWKRYRDALMLGKICQMRIAQIISHTPEMQGNMLLCKNWSAKVFWWIQRMDAAFWHVQMNRTQQHSSTEGSKAALFESLLEKWVNKDTIKPANNGCQLR